jgi:hypothetical protein
VVQGKPCFVVVDRGGINPLTGLGVKTREGVLLLCLYQ